MCVYLLMNINESGAAPLSKIVEKFKIFHIQPHLQFLSCIVCPNLCKIATFIHCITVCELRLKKEGLLRLRKRKSSEAALAAFRCRKKVAAETQVMMIMQIHGERANGNGLKL